MVELMVVDDVDDVDIWRFYQMAPADYSDLISLQITCFLGTSISALPISYTPKWQGDVQNFKGYPPDKTYINHASSASYDRERCTVVVRGEMHPWMAT